MLRSQSDRLDMITAVVTYLELNPEIVNSIDGLREAFEKLKNLQQEINESVSGQQEQIGGFFVQKDELKMKLVLELYTLVCSGLAFAAATGNNILYGQLHYPLSTLKKEGDEKIAPLADTIIEATTPYLTELEKYNYSAESLAALQQAKDKYVEFLAVPRTEQAKKINYTDLIKLKITEATLLLRTQLDHAVNTLLATNPAFYNEYHSCRKIITHGLRHTMLEGEVRAESTGTPVYDALVILNPGNLEMRTAFDGTFQSRVQPGVYTLTFKKEGYIEVTLDHFEINRGETVRKNIALTRAVVIDNNLAPEGEDKLHVA